jgi:glucose/mannose-6-phosphate isomerase
MSSETWNDLKTKLDRNHMFEDIVSFPKHMTEGKEIAYAAQLPQLDPSKFDNIIVCGMGGSAIGADLVRSYLGYKLKIPMMICRHYRIPFFASSRSLVIGSSYSGNTEETLSAIADAERIGAKIICITTGGKLTNIALEKSWPCVKIPSGMMPRAALAYSFVPLLSLLSRLGFAKDCDRDLDNAIAAAKSRIVTYGIDAASNRAAELAQRIYGRMPIVYAGQDHFDAVAVRFKGQICENSKQLAFFNFYPEFNHNELVGWEICDPFKEKLVVITLKDKDDHKRVTARMGIVNGWLGKKGVTTIELESDGDNLLSRMISLIQLGDFASFYLAMLNGADPSPVRVIDHLKSELDKV